MRTDLKAWVVLFAMPFQSVWIICLKSGPMAQWVNTQGKRLRLVDAKDQVSQKQR